MELGLAQLEHHPLNARSIHEYEQNGTENQTMAELAKGILSIGVSARTIQAIEPDGKSSFRYGVIDGNRYFESLVRLPEAQRQTIKLQVLVHSKDTKATDIIRLSILGNENLKPSSWSKLRALEELAKLGVTKQQDQAESLCCSPAEVSQLHKLLNLSSSIREAGEKGRLQATTALQLLKDHGERAIEDYLVAHPECLTRQAFEFTKLSDTLQEKVLRANKATTESNRLFETARTELGQMKGEIARASQALDAAKESKDPEAIKLIETQLKAIEVKKTTGEMEIKRLLMETAKLQVIENEARAAAIKAERVASAKRKGGKGTGGKQKKKAGAAGNVATDVAPVLPTSTVLVNQEIQQGTEFRQAVGDLITAVLGHLSGNPSVKDIGTAKDKLRHFASSYKLGPAEPKK